MANVRSFNQSPVHDPQVAAQHPPAVEARQLEPQGEVGDDRADDVGGRRGDRGTHEPACAHGPMEQGYRPCGWSEPSSSSFSVPSASGLYLSSLTLRFDSHQVLTLMPL